MNDKVYVRFTEEENEKREIITVYEAIINDNVVNILMPKTSHPAAIDFAKSIGFCDNDAYIVEGEFIGTDDRSRSLLKNPVYVHKLHYNRNEESYLLEKEAPDVKWKFDDSEFSFWNYLMSCFGLGY
jgi:hypothetical protein